MRPSRSATGSRRSAHPRFCRGRRACGVAGEGAGMKLKLDDLLELLDSYRDHNEVVCFARDLDRTQLDVYVGNKGGDRLVAGFSSGNVWRILRVEEKLGIAI